MKNLGFMGWLCYFIVILGCLNWLFVGLFRLDFVAMALGSYSFFARLVYILFGLAAVYLIVKQVKN